MAYNAYVVKIEKLRPHTNADRLQIATFFGNDTCVSLEAKVGDIGVYFPTDGQLSEEFCEKNNLVRKKDKNGNDIGGYMDPDKRNVKTIKLRGEASDGLYLPISCLDYIEHDFKVGDTIGEYLEGHEICKKYIPNSNKKTRTSSTREKKKKINIAPLFAEHADTAQLAYNLAAFRPGDEVEITLKMHGTSGRTALLPVLKGYKRTILDKLLRRKGTPVYEYDYVTGTRRVVLDSTHDGGYYSDNAFRKTAEAEFLGKLHKGETAYYEIVGWVNEETPIMATVSNKGVNDKDFIKKFGEKTVFSYGCEAGFCAVYVYRMTMTNEDGDVVEYTPDFMRYRCEQMAVKTVPLFKKFIIPSEVEDAGDFVKTLAEVYYDGEDPIGKTHVREGVVCRILNKPSFTAYKHKNLCFKIIEGIAKDTSTAPDIEEAQDLEINN